MGKKLTLFGIVLKQERTVSNTISFAKISPLRIVFIESARGIYQALALYDICYKDECPPTYCEKLFDAKITYCRKLKIVIWEVWKGK
jgi:hypothetical protein